MNNNIKFELKEVQVENYIYITEERVDGISTSMSFNEILINLIFLFIHLKTTP